MNDFIERSQRSRSQWEREVNQVSGDAFKQLVPLFVEDYRFQRQVRKLGVDAAITEIVEHIDTLCHGLRQQLSLEVSNQLAQQEDY